ncbi:potassium channel protein [Bacillus sp. P14.5]|uniref:potassium channel protein n=1 Tax=Bacillus sp. P14.5 TaxID=1983400 RepID=UPI000DEAE662|nr:potassium channel protein [Bacillus sp. P14.5]
MERNNRRCNGVTIFIRLWKKVSKMDFSVILFLSLAIVLFGTVSIHYLEPENFPTLFEGFWWTMTTLTTVGYGDYYPTTVSGRILGVFLFIFGIGIIGLLISKIMDVLATFNTLKREGKLLFKNKGHFIYIGWSSRTERAIKEVLAHKGDKQIVVIEQLDNTPFTHDQVHFISGDASDEEVLMKANILEADRVAIFSDLTITKPVLADGKSLLIASAVEALAKKHKANIHSVVEVMEEKNIPLFNHIEVDDFILSNDSVSLLMAKATLQPGTTGLFRQLLSKKFGKNIHEFFPLKDWHTYKDASHALFESGAVLIAVNEDMDFSNAAEKKLQKEDVLYIICDDQVYQTLRTESAT